jgi:signal peptidase II
MTLSVLAFFVAFASLALDRLVKVLAVKSLAQGQSVDVVPGIFQITLVHNTGAAFGIFRGFTVIFSFVSALVIVLITAYLVINKVKDRVFAVALGLILGGAVGNLIDRIWLGYVIDMFDFRVWPVFNVADSCITVGTVILAANILFRKECHASCIR